MTDEEHKRELATIRAHLNEGYEVCGDCGIGLTRDQADFLLTEFDELKKEYQALKVLWSISQHSIGDNVVLQDENKKLAQAIKSCCEICWYAFGQEALGEGE